MHAIFIAAYEEDVLGFAAMYANNKENKIAYISLIAVSTQAQNRHVGKQLLETCELLALQKGMNAVELEVSKENIGAIQFYKKNGYRYKCDASENTFYMKKEIQ